ncbi:MAG: formylglycine-generating enzyme family protein [Gammaproteobacteria bacterium]
MRFWPVALAAVLCWYGANRFFYTAAPADGSEASPGSPARVIGRGSEKREPLPSPEDGPFLDALQTPRLGPEMVTLPSGHFTMGSPVTEFGRRADEWPEHEVVIPQRFAISRHEVTFDDYDLFTTATGREPANDWGFGRGRHPVVNISLYEARAYAEWLTRETGHHYRLPSEAEWEYAARAGTTAARYWGEEPVGACRFANVADLSSRSLAINVEAHRCDDGFAATAPAGSFQANAFGLYDMIGNVAEWVQDCAHPNYKGAPNDGSAWIRDGDCGFAVVRGGAWSSEPSNARSAARDHAAAGTQNAAIGFRVVRDED